MSLGLLLVDIQNDYFPGGRMELVGMEAASASARDLLDLFRKRRWTTFHIQHIARAENAPFFRPNTPGAEIHESVKPFPNEPVIRKHFPNSFRETGLFEELRKAGVSKVVICGAMSHMCIDATTRAASDLGFRCVVVHDGCATRDLEFGGETIPAGQVHGSFMAALGAAYAQVLSSDELASGLEEGSAQ